MFQSDVCMDTKGAELRTDANPLIMRLLLSFPLHSMKNHEKSKKHRDMVVLLRQQLEEDDDSFGLKLDGKEGREEENEQLDDDEEEEEDRQRQKYESVSIKSCVHLVFVLIRTLWNVIIVHNSIMLSTDIFFPPLQAVQKTEEKKETAKSGACKY